MTLPVALALFVDSSSNAGNYYASSLIGRETGSTFAGALVNTTWLNYKRDTTAAIRTRSAGRICDIDA